MKILKSGIEMTPAELNKIKGGLCSCGCDIGFSGMRLNVLAEDKGGCYCGCNCVPSTEGQSEYEGSWWGAFIQY